jgi:dihydrofolate reductase
VARFAQSLSRLGLIDEYRLVIHPIALSAGLPLFGDLAKPLHLTLVEAQTFEGGAALHVYQPSDRRTTPPRSWPRSASGSTATSSRPT